MTPIEKFKELIELAEMVRDNSNTTWDLSTIGPDLLALVDVLDEWVDVTELRATRSGKTLGTNILKARAKLKEDE